MTMIWTSRITIFYDSSYGQEKAISTKDGACQGAYSLKVAQLASYEDHRPSSYEAMKDPHIQVRNYPVI